MIDKKLQVCESPPERFTNLYFKKKKKWTYKTLFFLELNFTGLNESPPKSVNSHMAQSTSSEKCKRQKKWSWSLSQTFLSFSHRCHLAVAHRAHLESSSSSLKIWVTDSLTATFLLNPAVIWTPLYFYCLPVVFCLSRRERNKLRQRSLPGTVAPPLHLLSFWRYSMRHLLWADSMRLLRYVDISFPFLDTLLCFNKRVWAQFKGGGLSLCSEWVKQQRLTFYATP